MSGGIVVLGETDVLGGHLSRGTLVGGKNYLELLLLVFHLGTPGLFGGSKQWQ